VHAQPPPIDGLASFPEVGELKTDNCFSTAVLLHLGQLIFSRSESTMASNSWLQREQLYSKIGMGPR
jgi:hypothetical protein